MDMKVEINGKEKELVGVHDEDGEYRHEVDNINFDGHRVLWSFGYEPKTYSKESELSGDEWRKGGSMWIKRNGVSVFKEFCRTPERAFVVLAYTLPKLQDFSFEYLKVGYKLYDHNVPVVIERICDDGEVMLRSESGENIPWPHTIEALKNGEETEDDNEWKDKDRIHILSEHLYWHRK